MVSFSTKKIAPPSLVGETLKNERVRRRLTVEEAANRSGLALRYIQILETNAWQKLPGQIYTKSFIKKYAQSLDLNAQELINQYLADNKKEWLLAAPKKTHPQAGLGLKHFRSLPFVLRKIAISGFLFILTFYLSYEVSGVFSPPHLVIESPADGHLQDGEAVEVKGFTEPEAKVQINGKEVLSDGSGAFKEMLALRQGLNVIKVSATKRHGGTSIVSRNVVVEPATN